MTDAPARRRLIAGHRRRRTPPGSPPGMMVADPTAPKPNISLMAYGPDTLEERHDVTHGDIDAFCHTVPVLWIDVYGLGDVAVLQAIGQKFDLHNLALEDVINVHQRPKMDDYDDHLFVVCRMPDANHGLDTEQVSFFLGEDFVITFQEKPGDCFEAVRNRLRSNRGRIRQLGPDYLLYALLDSVTDAYFPVLEDVGEHIDRLEELVMSSPEPDDVKHIHQLKRDLLNIRRAVWPQREMLNGMIRDDSPLVRDQTKLYLRDCFDHTIQLMDLIETYREIVGGLTDIFLSAQSTRMNEVMKVLTVIATIFMPLTLITGIYGMNFDRSASRWNMPELGWPFGYPMAVGAMLVIAVGMLLWFRRRGWIGRPKPRRLHHRPTHLD